MKYDIVRAWKDEEYRQSLSDEQMSALPANPAGELELTSAELASVYGGGGGFGVPAVAPAVAPIVPHAVAPVVGGGGAAFGSSVGAFGAREECFFQSVAIECENNQFSFNFSRNFNFLSDNDTICVNGN